MSATLERRYRRLLHSYPRAYRAARGDEMTGTLMDLSRPDQLWPAPRQAAALLLGGLRVRAGVDRLRSTGDAWRDGARAALVLMLTWQIIQRIWLVELDRADLPAGESLPSSMIVGSVTTGILAVGAMLLLRGGHNRLGLVLALLTPLPSLLPPLVHTWDNLYVFDAVSWWLPVIGLSVPLLRRPATTGPWRWQLAIPTLVLASALMPLLGLNLAALVAGLVMLALCLAWGTMIDPRPAIGLGLLLLTAIPQLVVSASVLMIVVPVFFILGSALLIAGALRARHRIPA